MSKYNIFQKNDLLRKVVAVSLEYPKDTNLKYGSFTESIYLSAYFYLCNRFGFPKENTFDGVKEAGAWTFKVKDYLISIRLSSIGVDFIVFGKPSKFPNHPDSPYQKKRWRAWAKNQDILIDVWTKNHTPKELKIMKILWKEFCEKHLDDTWTPERYNSDKAMQEVWLKHIVEHNNKVLGIPTWQECQEKYGEFVVNSNIRHAQRTLSQFIKNLLTPIYIRDVPYNIKGRISDEKSWEYERRFSKNILIELEK